MPRKRKKLPKDFKELIKTGDLSLLKEIFDKCELDAYSGYTKISALGFSDCPDELTQWLVENGADINYRDTYGNTPLHLRVTIRHANISILINLGADINIKNNSGSTPLHCSPGYQQHKHLEVLLAAGAKVDVKNRDGLTPLEYALLDCTNICITNMPMITDVFFRYGVKVSPKMQALVKEIGERFEFYRESFSDNDDYDEALTKLYSAYNVTAVPARVIHDGKSVIELNGSCWQENFDLLWDSLIPSSGPSLTVQGEVIRIAGRVADEILRNGGGNWDCAYKALCDAYLVFIASHNSLTQEDVTSIKRLLSDPNLLMDEADKLQHSAVKWVAKNTTPIALKKPTYNR